ncbi:hypothetical protein GC209_14135 [bacterium]|nr:hypothetical protein [bacterium]
MINAPPASMGPATTAAEVCTPAGVACGDERAERIAALPPMRFRRARGSDGRTFGLPKLLPRIRRGLTP